MRQFLRSRYIPIQSSCANTRVNKITAIMARPLSTSLIAGACREARRGAIDGAGRGGAEGTDALLGTAEGAAGNFWVAAAVRETAAVGTEDGAGLAPIAGAGAGIFTVGAAVGFGGRLIRTVSFFG